MLYKKNEHFRSIISNKKPDDSNILKLDKFIQKLPAVPSRHNCSILSNKRYLPADLRNLYIIQTIL